MSELERRIDLLASDRESGASEILDEAIAILRTALEQRRVLPVARALCRAQPAMASIWNASLAALAAVDEPREFEPFAARVARAPEALGRFARDCLAEEGGSPSMPLRIVTLSFSRSVVAAVDGLAPHRPFRIACSEGRPALEGRRLAARLASQGVAVTFFSDAAIGHALGAADVVLVGADAVAPEWFLNKSGTRMLATAALEQAVPMYVVASRDKFVSHAVSAHIAGRDGAAADIWESAPSGVNVRNPYFESTPLHLVASVITDMGVVGAGLVPDICEAAAGDVPPDLIEKLR